MKWRLRAETQPIIEDEDGRTVATAASVLGAKQIIIEHNAHHGLVNAGRELLQKMWDAGVCNIYLHQGKPHGKSGMGEALFALMDAVNDVGADMPWHEACKSYHHETAVCYICNPDEGPLPGGAMAEAEAATQAEIDERAAEARNADHIDGYDRDDLGESPDC